MSASDPAASARLRAHADYYRAVDGPIGGRDRFEWFDRAYFSGVSGARVLEIGCGEGSLLELIRARGNDVRGVDISESGVARAKAKSIQCVLADASNERLPYEDASFDAVVTLETIEHVENPHRMIWEIKRVLKEDGMLLISIPGEKVHHPFIYPGLFSKKNFVEFLECNGLKVRSVRGWGQAPLWDTWQRSKTRSGMPMVRVLARMVHYLGRKRNVLMRKHLGTPLRWAYTMNFECVSLKRERTRVEEVAALTTPL